jgi:uncharacterized protein (DUF2344 family)
MRGRISSVNAMFVGSSDELEAFEISLVRKLIKPVAAVVFEGTMTVVTVVATGIANPVLLDLDLTKEIEENEKEASHFIFKA